MQDSEGKKSASEDRESLEALEDSESREATHTETLIRHGNSSTNVHGTVDDGAQAKAIGIGSATPDNSSSYVHETAAVGANANAPA
jgi:hypothetical protein